MKHLIVAVLLCLFVSSLSAQYFTEDWSNESFSEWNISPYQPWNINISTDYGDPPPSCTFEYYPQVTNYNFALTTDWLNAATAMSPVLSFALMLDNYSFNTVEYMTVEARSVAVPAWTQLDQWSNTEGSFDWQYFMYDLQPLNIAGGMQLRFRFHGEDSTSLNAWFIDNIVVQEAPAMCTVSGFVTSVEIPYGPIEDATVSFDGWTTVTAQDGSYSVSVPLGDYDCVCSAFGYADNDTHTNLPLSSTTYTLNIEMTPVPIVSGIVTDLLNGAPIQNAEIFGQSDFLSQYLNTMSGSDGAYALSTGVADDWIFTCYKNGEYEAQSTSAMQVYGNTQVDFAMLADGADDGDSDPENAYQIDVTPFTHDGIVYPSTDNDWFYVFADEEVGITVYTERYNGGNIDPVIEVTGPSLMGPPFSDIDPYAAIWTDDASGGDDQPYLQFLTPVGGDGFYLIRVITDDGSAAYDGDIGYYRLHVDVTDNPISADFTVDQTAGVAPFEVQFTDTSTGIITDWLWDFGDGESSTEQHPLHTYDYPGDYTVRLDASNGADSDFVTYIDLISVMVNIPNEALRVRINETLGYAPPIVYSHNPTVDEMASVVSLDASGLSIDDITGVEYLVSCSWLDLHDNLIDDPAPLGALGALQSLNLNNNPLPSLEILAELSSLHELFISGTGISDLTPITGLPLTTLRAAENNIESLSVLADMTQLQTLDLHENDIVDLDGLCCLTNLTHLYLQNNMIKRLTGLEMLDSIICLNLDNNEFADIWPLLQNSGLAGAGDSLSFDLNGISLEAMNVHLPLLLEHSIGVLHAPSTVNPYAPCFPSPEREACNVQPSTTLTWEVEATSIGWFNLVVWDSDEMVLHDEIIPMQALQTVYSYPVSLQDGESYTWTVISMVMDETSYGGIWPFCVNDNGMSADFTATNTSGPAPLTVQFYDASTAQATTITEWSWDFDNDGDIDAVYDQPTDPTWTYYQDGVYDVSLTVSDGAGSNTAVMEQLVTVTGSYFPAGAEITGFFDETSGVNTVEADAYVPVGETLEIQGAGFLFMPGARLHVEGTLIVNGGSFNASNQMEIWHGVYFHPTSEGCSFTSSSIIGAVPAVEIDGCTPVFTDVDVQLDQQFAPPDYGWATLANSNATPWLNDVRINGYDYGVHLQDIVPIGRELPVLDDVQIVRRDPSTATDATAILMQNATAQITGLQTDGFTYGVVMEDWAGGMRTTPTLTNIRVRNSGGATRDDDVGIYLVDVAEVEVYGDSILQYTTGIVIETTDTWRNSSTPTLTNIRVRNSGGATRNGDTAIKLAGQVNGMYRDIVLEGYGTGVELLADSTASQPMEPVFRQLTMYADTLETRQPGFGLYAVGEVACNIDTLLIDGYPAGVLIEGQSGGTRATPTLTNIRVRNSNGATRPDTIGVAIMGAVDIVIENAEIDDFDTGLLFSNTNTRDSSTPTLTNIRVRNSGGATRTETWGLRFEGAVAAQVNGAEIEECTYGVFYSDFQGQSRTTPTLTNIRVRNSGGATREAAIGVWIEDVSEITVEGDSIVGYPIGVQVESAPGRTSSTPTITNIRVRNSGGATRPDNVGVQLIGSVDALISDLDIEGFDHGLHYTGDGVGRRTTPTLTNIRVRNSGGATRTPVAGVTIIDVPNISLMADTVMNYPTGYQFINNTGGQAGVTAQEIAAIQEGAPQRLDGVGILLGDGIDGTLVGGVYSGYGVGAQLGNGVNSLSQGVFRNCDSGVGVHGAQQADINLNLFYLDGDFPPTRVPGPAVHLHGAQGVNLNCNTIHNYNVGVQADTSNAVMQQTIIWKDEPLLNPIVSNGRGVQASFCDISFVGGVWGDSTNINANPEFTDPANGDFYLEPSSPCIDGGNPDNPWDPEGNAPDIGALYYPHMAEFDVSPRFATINTPVQFTDASVGHPGDLSDFFWDFNNDGVIDEMTQNPLYVFDAPGVYDIRFVTSTATLADTAFHYHYCVYQEHQLEAPQGVFVMRQGDDIHLAWQPVTQTTAGQPVAVTNYLVYASDDPQESFEYIGMTDGATLTFTHNGVCVQEDRQYYFVLAFMGNVEDRGSFISAHSTARFDNEGVHWNSQKQNARR